jgi:hypothetical protein
MGNGQIQPPDPATNQYGNATAGAILGSTSGDNQFAVLTNRLQELGTAGTEAWPATAIGRSDTPSFALCSPDGQVRRRAILHAALPCLENTGGRRDSKKLAELPLRLATTTAFANPVTAPTWRVKTAVVAPAATVTDVGMTTGAELAATPNAAPRSSSTR